MRILQYGAEVPLDQRGWTVDGFNSPVRTTEYRRRSPAGVGGNRSLNLDFSTVRHTLGSGVVEAWVRYGVLAQGGYAILRMMQGGTEALSVRLFNGIGVYVAGQLEDDSTEVLASFTWYVLTLHFRMTSEGGLCDVYLDHDLQNPVCSVSGDLDPLGLGHVDTIEFEAHDVFLDDIVVHVPSLRFDGAYYGLPQAGDTITGATSGATAVVSSAEDLGGNTGRAFLHSVSGTFVDDERIVYGQGFDAYVDGDGLEPHSGAPSTFGYVVVMGPEGQGTNTACVPVGSATNYGAVDELATTGEPDDDTYVMTETSGAVDTYTLGQVAAGATGVNHVEVLARAQRTGSVIGQIEPALRIEGANAYGDAQALATAWGAFSQAWDRRPDGEAWSLDDLDDLEIGFRLQT